jgi:hypothetical protein
MNQAPLQHGFSIPPHMSPEACEWIARALASGQPDMAKAIANHSRNRLSIEEVDTQALGELLQQRWDVVMVGNANHASTATALNEAVPELGS